MGTVAGRRVPEPGGRWSEEIAMRAPQPPVALVVALGLLAVSASAALHAAGPVAVPAATVVDVGTTPRGETIEHSFVIANEGDAPLELTDVRPSCGCTVARFDAVVAPGQRGEIHAEVRTTGFRGAIAKSITVLTNDPRNPRIQLVVKALLQTPVEVEPGYARFVTIDGSPAKPAEQTVWSPDHPDLEILEVRSPLPFVEVERLEGEAESGRHRLVVHLADDAPIGPFGDRIVVVTDHPEKPEVTIPVTGNVRPMLAVLPPVAELGQRDLAEPFVASLLVRNLSSSAIRLGEAEVDVEGVEVAVKPLEEGAAPRQYRIEVTLTSGMEPGPFEGEIRVPTTSERMPVVTIPLNGTVL